MSGCQYYVVEPGGYPYGKAIMHPFSYAVSPEKSLTGPSLVGHLPITMGMCDAEQKRMEGVR